jgi:hypothetical protein
MEDQETCDRLIDAGFTTVEIARLQRLRQDYVKHPSSYLPATTRRRKFKRWLENIIFWRPYPEWTIYQ